MDDLVRVEVDDPLAARGREGPAAGGFDEAHALVRQQDVGVPTRDLGRPVVAQHVYDDDLVAPRADAPQAGVEVALLVQRDDDGRDRGDGRSTSRWTDDRGPEAGAPRYHRSLGWDRRAVGAQSWMEGHGRRTAAPPARARASPPTTPRRPAAARAGPA